MKTSIDFLFELGYHKWIIVCFAFMQGTVIIIANHGERIDIPTRTLLENKIVSGNLRIRDH